VIFIPGYQQTLFRSENSAHLHYSGWNSTFGDCKGRNHCSNFKQWLETEQSAESLPGLHGERNARLVLVCTFGNSDWRWNA
jgi:hypothetical protein